MLPVAGLPAHTQNLATREEKRVVPAPPLITLGFCSFDPLCFEAHYLSLV